MPRACGWQRSLERRAADPDRRGRGVGARRQRDALERERRPCRQAPLSARHHQQRERAAAGQRADPEVGRGVAGHLQNRQPAADRQIPAARDRVAAVRAPADRRPPAAAAVEDDHAAVVRRDARSADDEVGAAIAVEVADRERGAESVAAMAIARAQRRQQLAGRARAACRQDGGRPDRCPPVRGRRSRPR